jgi:hypothetical protein
VSAEPVERRGALDAVAGFMAAAALAVASLGIVYKPVRVVPAAILVALVAVAMGGRHVRLAGWAVVWGAICWIAGMTVAVLTERALF